MKYILTIILFVIFLSVGCTKDEVVTVPIASFTFRGDTSNILKMGTYDTCSLQSTSTNSDSTFWDLGNGTILQGDNIILTYSSSGNYTIKMTVKNKSGQESSITKKVRVLDRVLKKIIIKTVYWDTIPNTIPNFNAVWPTSSIADIFVLVQKFVSTDSIVPKSGIMPNSPVLYQSPVIHNISNKSNVSIQIDVPNKFIIDKKMVLEKTFAISLMAKDKTGNLYSLQSSLENGCSFGIQQENFAGNKFVLVCNLFSAIEFDCDFE